MVINTYLCLNSEKSFYLNIVSSKNIEVGSEVLGSFLILERKKDFYITNDLKKEVEFKDIETKNIIKTIRVLKEKNCKRIYKISPRTPKNFICFIQYLIKNNKTIIKDLDMVKFYTK